MSDYSELVERLRRATGSKLWEDLADESAAAIEELQARVKTLESQLGESTLDLLGGLIAVLGAVEAVERPKAPTPTVTAEN